MKEHQLHQFGHLIMRHDQVGLIRPILELRIYGRQAKETQIVLDASGSRQKDSTSLPFNHWTSFVTCPKIRTQLSNNGRFGQAYIQSQGIISRMSTLPEYPSVLQQSEIQSRSHPPSTKVIIINVQLQQNCNRDGPECGLVPFEGVAVVSNQSRDNSNLTLRSFFFFLAAIWSVVFFLSLGVRIPLHLQFSSTHMQKPNERNALRGLF